MGASYAPERLEIAVGKSNYSRVSCHEYDFDRAEHLNLTLDTKCSFVANVACADARFLRYCNPSGFKSIVPTQEFDNLKHNPAVT